MRATCPISSSFILASWQYSVKSTNYEAPHYAIFSTLLFLPPPPPRVQIFSSSLHCQNLRSYEKVDSIGWCPVQPQLFASGYVESPLTHEPNSCACFSRHQLATRLVYCSHFFPRLPYAMWEGQRATHLASSSVVSQIPFRLSLVRRWTT
jgi:hypothetical protein